MDKHGRYEVWDPEFFTESGRRTNERINARLRASARDDHEEWVSQTFVANGDGKGAGDWFAENGDAVVDAVQAAGVATATALGFGAVAAPASQLVDAIQAEAARGGSAGDVVLRLCEVVRSLGWPTVLGAVALAGRPDVVRVMLDRGVDVSPLPARVRGYYPRMRSVAPELWELDGAPYVAGDALSAAATDVAGSAASFLGSGG